jgi:hypothetical protein
MRAVTANRCRSSAPSNRLPVRCRWADQKGRDARRTHPTVVEDAPEGAPDLGDAGRKAIAEERSARRAAEKAARDAQSELERIRSESMSSTEKAIAEAKAQGRKEALSTANDRLVKAEVRAHAAGKLADPGDAAALLGDLSGFVGDDGEPDSRAIAKAIDDLLEAKPYLAAGATPGTTRIPAGARGGNAGEGDMNQLLRQAAGLA